MTNILRAYLPATIKAWLEMLLLNDGFLSLNLNENSESEDEFNTAFGSKSNLQGMMLGNYNLFDMMRQFWATCPSTYRSNSHKSPWISAIIHKISDNPFDNEEKKGIILMLVRDYQLKFKNDNPGESWKRKNCNSMPIDSQESRFHSISYPIYPDNINYASIIIREITWKILINLYFAILWQEKIIIITDMYERVSLIIEAIFKLMYPLDTSIYTTIGFISEDMADFIQAPLPFIVGWSSSVYKTIESHHSHEISTEIVVLNMNTEEVSWKNKIKFPYPQTDYWKTKYFELVKWVKRIKEFRNYDSKNYYIDLSDHSFTSIKTQIMINLEINMKIKKLFVNFMILLLGNCQDFILIDENCSFDSINFLSKTPQNNRSFYKKVRHTKLVNSPNLISL